MRGGGVCWDMSSTCVQGGLPRPLGGYQPNLMMEAHSPAPAWHMHHSLVPKQEPMDEERNDSGVTSGSDFHSSSPGSDNSQDFNPAYSSPSISNNQTNYYTTPVTSQYPQLSTTSFHPGFNPLTPPISEPMISPKIKNESNTTLTPHASPTTSQIKSQEDGEDPLKRLQMSLEKNGFLPTAPFSPKPISEHSNDDEKSEQGDEVDEDGVRIPKINSHGKVKMFKCKQCDFIAITKLDFWEHSKGHIKTDKLLTCPKCPFVTEYKHHLEYHLRNHFGSKPFKCDKCSYSCVNKSMLNSHMKSHSNVYQYRCKDCSYATKYCHSLKLHLRKYSHQPAMVLNPDGTPNPLPIIDVYGTRRGPKQKSGTKVENGNDLQIPQNPFTQFMMGTPQLSLPFGYPFMGGFPGALTNPLLFPQIQQHLNQEIKSPEEENERTSPVSNGEDENGALDLSKPEGTKNRRKGRAFKLDRSYNPEESEGDEDEECTNTNLMEPEITLNEKPNEEKEEEASNNNNHNDYSCQFCCISFGDVILYTMHMGYHGYKDPFTCNMCGEQCNDKVAFFLHIARNPHT